MVVGAMAGSANVPQGPFEGMAAMMSPGPSQSPTVGAPNATTPNAKRPVDKMSIDVAQGGSRVMTQEDLSAGFHNLMGLQQRDEKFTKNIAECTHYNAELLNALITRVNAVEASVGLQQAATEALTSDVHKALQMLESEDGKKDSTLRAELSAMAVRLEEGHKELQEKLEHLNSQQGRQPLPPPGIEGPELMMRNLNKVQGAVDGLSEKMTVAEKHVEQTLSRVNDLEIKSQYLTQGCQELQGNMSAMRIEVEQVRLEVSSAPGAGVKGDPWWGQKLGEPAGPSAQGQQPSQLQSKPTHYNLSPGGGDGGYGGQSGGKWKLYDEKYILEPSLSKQKFDARKPLEWTQSLRDYLAGRCEEVDAVLNWAELQV